jgi:hypothetical protein
MAKVKIQKRCWTSFWSFRFHSFVLVSDFVLGISDFESPLERMSRRRTLVGHLIAKGWSALSFTEAAQLVLQ